MKIIDIPFDTTTAQSGGGVKLAKDIAQALADAISWEYEETETGGNVKNEKSSIYFAVADKGGSNYYVEVNLGNEYVTTDHSVSHIIYYTSSTTPHSDPAYRMFVFESAEGSIGVGLGKTTAVPYIGVLIAQNLNDEYIGFSPSQYSSDEYMRYIRPLETEVRDLRRLVDFGSSTTSSILVNSGNVIILKYPDIVGGVMFKDIYLIYACPSDDKARVLYINGIYYRVLSSTYSGLAVPDPDM